MPTYTVTTPTGTLDSNLRAALAREITRVHGDATGAAPVLAQVLFRDLDREAVFVGGEAPRADHIFISATIRAGRSDSTLQTIFDALRDAVVATTKVPARNVWVYIAELDHTRMMEYGRMLPLPGMEDAWLDQEAGRVVGDD